MESICPRQILLKGNAALGSLTPPIAQAQRSPPLERIYIGSRQKKSETILTGLETSDVSFVRLRCRPVLFIANKLTSDF